MALSEPLPRTANVSPLTSGRRPRASASVGDKISAPLAQWTFGDGVFRTFDDHVRRSVPQYDEGHDLTLALSEFIVPTGGVIYELGCSTGALTRKLALRHADRGVRVVGIDIESEMVEEARRRSTGVRNAEFVCADITQLPLSGCDLVVSYYTLQFVPQRRRTSLLHAVADALPVGGALVLFEKVREPDSLLQDVTGQLYNDFKLTNGFGADEILAKTRSLRAVLDPLSSRQNIDALHSVGFSSVGLVHKALCFEGYLAVK